MSEDKAVDILEAYIYQLRDRKPFEYQFTDMQEAIETIFNLYEKEKVKCRELEAINFNVNKNLIEQLETTYNNGVYTGQKATEEVIKDTIKELEEDIQYSANPLSIDNSKFTIKILKNILGDEEENK